MSRRKNWKTIVAILVAVLFATLMILTVTMPAAVIMVEKGAAGNPTAIVSLIVALATGVAICAATMTAIRSRPDDAPIGVIARMRMLFAIASAGLGGAVVFAFGILVGLFNASFTAEGIGESVMFWLTAVLLGVGAATLLLTLLGIMGVHFANAMAFLFEKPALASSPADSPPEDSGVSRELTNEASPTRLRADVGTPMPEPVPQSEKSKD